MKMNESINFMQVRGRIMVNELGKLLRKWRIDKGVSMREMAKDIGVSAAFLSAIELSKKKINDSLVNKIIEYFKLDSKKINKLNDSVANSIEEVKINLTTLSDSDKEDVFAFARKYETLSEEKKAQIRRLLNE